MVPRLHERLIAINIINRKIVESLFLHRKKLPHAINFIVFSDKGQEMNKQIKRKTEPLKITKLKGKNMLTN